MTNSATAYLRGRARPAPIRWLRDHPTQADLIFAVVLTTIAVGVHIADIETADEHTEPAWWTVLLVIASVFPIAWRRSHPVETAATVVCAQVVAAFADIDGTGFIGVLVALYSLGAHSSGRRRTRLLVAASIAIGVLFVAGLVADELDVGGFVSSVVALVTAFVLGDNLRRRREAADALQERLARAERERELVAQQQVSAERTRIARELHDVVAHSVSVMVIQAAAARRSLAVSPENVETALSNVESTGRRTMDELRGILSVLRSTNDDPAPDRADRVGPSGQLTPQPRLADVPSLVEASDDLPVTLEISADLSDLGTATDLTGYRIVQESLTNVRRHAGPVSSVVITVERSADEVIISVVDDGRGAAADQAGVGYGLMGMRERVDAAGGRMSAGWRVGGGWSVTARLPASTLPAGWDAETEVIG